MEQKSLFFVTIVARPAEGTEDFGAFGGAYVNCWIDAAIESEAVRLAEGAIRESEWQPLTIEGVATVTRETYEEGDEGLEYFDQAVADGMIVVFNTWPNEPQEEDELH